MPYPCVISKNPSTTNTLKIQLSEVLDNDSIKSQFVSLAKK